MSKTALTLYYDAYSKHFTVLTHLVFAFYFRCCWNETNRLDYLEELDEECIVVHKIVILSALLRVKEKRTWSKWKAL